MTRSRSVLTCAIAGHRWGVTSRSDALHRTPAGLYAPRFACLRCGLSHDEARRALSPRQLLAAAVPLLVACVVGAVVVLIAGGAR